MISSVQNERIKNYAKLNEKKYRDESNLFIIEGLHLVEEAKKYNIIKEVITTNPNIDGTLVSEDVMKKITNQKSVVEVCAICKRLENKNITDKILILDNIQDPGNMGTILRTLDSAGLNQIIVTKETADAYNPKVVRSTMGAIFRVNVIV